MTQVIDVVNEIEKFAPKNLAEPGDPIGLQIGRLSQETKRVLVTLDVRPEVVDEAVTNHVDFIFSHHPVMFRPARNLDLSNAQNKMYADLIKHDITVYSAHTNIDKAKVGMNDWLTEALGLKNVEPFAFEMGEDGAAVGLGRKGTLPEKMTVDELTQKVKSTFGLSGLRLVSNDPARPVKKVGIIGGDGGKFYPKAVANGLDVFITGDVYYHTAHDMLADGLDVIDPGHHVEAIFKEKMSQKLQEWNDEFGWGLKIMASELSTDPYRFM